MESGSPELKATELRAFFIPEAVVGIPQVSNRLTAKAGDKCRFSYYAIPAAIYDRLDTVMGVDSWSEEYGGNGEWVECTLRLRFEVGPDWVQRVGRASAGLDWRAAQADALREAAFKFGIGRYLAAFACDGTLPAKAGEFPPLPEEALPVEAKRCGREAGEKIRKLLNQACEEQRKALAQKGKGGTVDNRDVAKRLAAKWGYQPDEGGEVIFGRVQNRHTAPMMRELNEWLAQIAREQLGT